MCTDFHLRVGDKWKDGEEGGSGGNSSILPITTVKQAPYLLYFADDR